jgi:phage-related protein
MRTPTDKKPLFWVRSSKKDLMKFPNTVIDTVGHALGLAQNEEKYYTAKPLKGFGPGVLEIVEDHNTDTYRAIYTVHFEKAVYVLHCFQKKSTQGISTPKQEIDLVQQRLKDAEADYKERFK